MKRAASISETIVALLAFLFLYTALSKYADLRVFRYSLSSSPILKTFTKPVSVLLPALEILIVILLTLPRTRLLGLYSSLILLSIFTIYLICMISFSTTLPCGCGGVISQLSWKGHIFFNIFFVALAAIGIRLQKRVLHNNNLKLAIK